MAFTARHNITTELTQNLVSAGDNAGFIKSVTLGNVHIRSSSKVDLLIHRSSGDHYIIKNVVIPSGTTLVVDLVDIRINTSTGNDSLRIKLTKGDTFTLTGSINVTGTNTTVPGSGTAFLTELSIGDEIVVDGETRIISSITSDVLATVSVAWGSDLDDDASPDCNPAALIDVIINN